MQAFPRVSLQKSFLEAKMRSSSVLFPRRVASGVFRESMLRDVVTETLGKLFNLHQKQHCVGWWWSAHRFHLAHTVRTKRIEPHTVLLSYQVLSQLGT